VLRRWDVRGLLRSGGLLYERYGVLELYLREPGLLREMELWGFKSEQGVDEKV
jgi:hypothetical protein